MDFLNMTFIAYVMRARVGLNSRNVHMLEKVNY